jgi:hypothetical protein
MSLTIAISYPTSLYSRVLHDDEANDGKQRIGFPEVYPLYWKDFVPLGSDWQWFWFRQLIHAYTGFVHWDEKRLSATELNTLKGKWASLTKSAEAFTNYHGTDTCHDYIRNVNTGAEIPKQGAITCCGNVVKVIGEPTGKGTPIETLDGLKPPPDIAKVNRLTTPWLIFLATNVPANKTDPKNWKPIILSDGRYRVDPFPQLPNVPVPLRTNGNKSDSTYMRDGINYAVNYITTSRLIKVIGIPSPYVI